MNAAVKQSSGALSQHAKYGKTHGPNRTSQGQAEEAKFSHQPNIITLASRCHCRQHRDVPEKEKETYKVDDGEREGDTQSHMELSRERDGERYTETIQNLHHRTIVT